MQFSGVLILPYDSSLKGETYNYSSPSVNFQSDTQ